MVATQNVDFLVYLWSLLEQGTWN